MIAGITVEYFDDPLQPDCRELSNWSHCAAAMVATGSILVILLASRCSHHRMCDDESVYSVKVGSVRLLLKLIGLARLGARYLGLATAIGSVGRELPPRSRLRSPRPRSLPHVQYIRRLVCTTHLVFEGGARADDTSRPGPEDRLIALTLSGA
jgi:hypothetical protein